MVIIAIMDVRFTILLEEHDANRNIYIGVLLCYAEAQLKAVKKEI